MLLSVTVERETKTDTDFPTGRRILEATGHGGSVGDRNIVFSIRVLYVYNYK